MSTPLPSRSQRRNLKWEGRPPEEEFLAGASNPAGLSRKEFLRLMGASLALAGGAACTRQPPEEIVPYVRQPEGLTPGKPLWFATAIEYAGDAHGLLVRSHEGRPTKIEGNPEHPMSLGRSSVHAQAALLDLYDPGRSQLVRHRGSPSTWEDLLAALLAETAKWTGDGGAGVRLLTEPSTSPTLRAQIAAFLAKYPQARWHQHGPAFPDGGLRFLCDWERADVILSFDADFLGVAGNHPRDAALFSQRRQPEGLMNRLYVLESMPSLTGAMADHRFALNPRELETTAVALLRGLEGGVDTAPAIFQPLLRDLLAHPGRAAVLTGEYQPASVRGAARAMNAILQAPVREISGVAATPKPEPFAKLWDGETKALIILGANPAHTSAGSEPWRALAPEFFTLHCGAHFDETAAGCAWHVPHSHFLEAWSDVRAIDGTVSIVQPLIEPLYPTKSKHEVLGALLGDSRPGYELLRAAWQARYPREDFEPFWRKTLHDGFFQGLASEEAQGRTVAEAPPIEDGLQVLFRPDPHLLDGALANNPWLQELPRPMTRLTWGNAAHLSAATAAKHGVSHGDEVELQREGRKVLAPVWIMPGHADDCVTLHLGGGRTAAGGVGNEVGYNAYPFQDARSPWLVSGVAIRRTGRTHHFATTQEHQDMADSDPVRVLARGQGIPKEELDSLYPPWDYQSPSWGMVIDLSTCTGCGTCTIACQAENNIPVVGREEVIRGREMHWIRVDRYFDGDPGTPRLLHQPVPCMHCENAPCELVCPVAATVHDHQGLNLMIYNRCVGTRYCSNNCPYKVRRFNFFQYADAKTPQLALQRNPEVSVRSRGVMEKCTYCVQRIHAAEVEARIEDRGIRDGEVVPACAQACPASAITFGDLANGGSRVSAERAKARNYALLGELNTRPRTTYLAKVYNPNPEMSA